MRKAVDPIISAEVRARYTMEDERSVSDRFLGVTEDEMAAPVRPQDDCVDDMFLRETASPAVFHGAEHRDSEWRRCRDGGG